MRLGLQTGSLLGTPHVYLVPENGNSLGSLRGMGDAALDQQIASVAVTTATTTVGILAALHVVIAGTALAGPVGIAVGAAIAAVGAIADVLIKEFSGCGQTCVIAANDANKFEAYLQQNIAAYLSSPIHYASLQQAALNNFDTIWNALVAACSDPSLGQAGQKCVGDRQRGACTWKASPGQWTKDASGNWTYQGAGAAGSGTTCWNWFVGYRDPIANDPSVVPDPVPGQSTGTDPVTGLPLTGGNGASTGISPLLLIGGAGLLLLAATS